jgi:hypothetical protein
MQDNEYATFKTLKSRRIGWNEHETGMKEIPDTHRLLAGRRLGTVNWNTKREIHDFRIPPRH